MKKKYTKLTNVRYRNGESGPSELFIDLEQFDWVKDIPVGPFNLNTKVYKAVKEVTGKEIESCNWDSIILE